MNAAAHDARVQAALAVADGPSTASTMAVSTCLAPIDAAAALYRLTEAGIAICYGGGYRLVTNVLLGLLLRGPASADDLAAAIAAPGAVARTAGVVRERLRDLRGLGMVRGDAGRWGLVPPDDLAAALTSRSRGMAAASAQRGV